MINKHIYKKCLFLTVVSQHVALTLVKKVSVEYTPWKNPYFTLNSTKSKQITSLLFVTPKRSGNLTFLDIFWGNRSIFYKIHLNFKQNLETVAEWIEPFSPLCCSSSNGWFERSELEDVFAAYKLASSWALPIFFL